MLSRQRNFLTRSTALSPAFEGRHSNRRSGSTLSQPWPLRRGVEGLISMTVAFFAFTLMLAGISPAAEKVIRVAVGVDATSLDPPMSTNLTDKNTTSQVFDTLLQRNREMGLEPNLVTSWKIVNSTTWELELKRGIKFHNGEDFNGEAVKLSIERKIGRAHV